MTHLVETIRRMMGEHRPPLSQVDVCKKTGLSPSHFSHILNGRQDSVSLDDLAKLARALSPDPKIQAEVIHAHLLDHIPRNFKASKFISCEVTGAMREEPTPYRTIKLAPDLEHDFSVLRASAPHDPDLREMIHRLAKYKR